MERDPAVKTEPWRDCKGGHFDETELEAELRGIEVISFSLVMESGFGSEGGLEGLVTASQPKISSSNRPPDARSAGDTIFLGSQEV